MQKTLLLILIAFTLSVKSFSQELIFCEQVDHMGIPKNASTEFTMSKSGGFFKILVKLNKKVESKSVVFDVYNLIDGKEILDNSLKMDVEPSITWFYKEVTFHKAGEFNVYVYDERDKLLAVGKVVVKFVN